MFSTDIKTQIFSPKKKRKAFLPPVNTDAIKCISYLTFFLDLENCTKGAWYCIHRWNL